MADPDLAPGLQVRLFGPLDIRVQGVPLAPLRSRKGRWLLALLILRPNREVAREWLAGTLWPDSDDAVALATLRRTLTDLRQALGAQAAALQSPTPQTLLLDMAGVQADLTDFDTLLAKGDDDALTRAIALYRGPLLEGCSEEWIVPDREARTQAYLHALETLAERARERRQHDRAVPYLQLLIKIDPLQETAQRGLMLALAESGNRAAALQVYQEFRRLLRREMNTDPDAETTRLFQQIRTDTREPKPQPPPEVKAVRPAELKAVSPPSTASQPLAALPIPLTPFVGREREIRELLERVETTPLLSLTGTGGIGKTRLSLRIATEAQEAFRGSVWFVDLSTLSDSQLVIPHVAATLHLREQSEQPLVKTLSDALATRPTLLILDNCEQILDAVARLTRALLQACPHLRIVTTTRQSLGIPGEVIWRVPSLSLPDTPAPPAEAEFSPEHLARYEAIQLFVKRAVAVMPTFALTAATAAATVQICRCLDGIPLALELAAARMNVLSVQQIAQRLEDRFRLLTTGPRSGPRRQQTLRAAIDWSYDQLLEPERCLLRRLSIFIGGWTLEAAEAICPDGEDTETGDHSRITEAQSLDVLDILDLLGQLVDRSLVTVEGGEAGATRYRLMETIRQYALERLGEADEEEALQDRHRSYYLLWAESRVQLQMGMEQAEGLKLVDAEHDNLRAALSGGNAESRIRLAGALWRFWWIRGYYTEGRAWLRAALATEGAVDSEIRAKALGGAAALAGDQQDYAAALIYSEEFLAIRRQTGNPIGIARALNNLGLCLLYQARYAEARPVLEESLELKREANDVRGIAQSLGNLGIIAAKEGDLERADLLQTECLEICRQLGDTQSTSWALCNLGDIALKQNSLETARSHFREALHLSHELQERRGIGVALGRLGIIACRQGNLLPGVRLMGASERHLNLLGVRSEPSEGDESADMLTLARQRLGDRAVDTARNAGQALSTDPAVALALEVTA